MQNVIKHNENNNKIITLKKTLSLNCCYHGYIHGILNQNRDPDVHSNMSTCIKRWVNSFNIVGGPIVILSLTLFRHHVCF